MSGIKDRAKSLVDSMTLREKISQMVHQSPVISRLNIPAYNWWNECLHGVGRAGMTTVFPQPIGMAAMFDESFMKEIASAISTEVRAKYNEATGQDDFVTKVLKALPDAISGWLLAKKYWYRGLTCWSPNINIFCDTRWGGGHETYGEDPFLTSRLGVALVQGLQGDHPDYLKVVATPKHFAVHSGPEGKRHSFNAVVSRKDLYETYLPDGKYTWEELLNYGMRPNGLLDFSITVDAQDAPLSNRDRQRIQNSIRKLVGRDHDNLWSFYRSCYKYTDCGPTIGFLVDDEWCMGVSFPIPPSMTSCRESRV